MPFAKNLKASGYRYSAGWDYPIVSAIPKISWVAGDGARIEGGPWAYVHAGKEAVMRPDGTYAFRIRFGGSDAPWADSSDEIRYALLRPAFHTWDKLSFIQPENYYHRKHDAFYVEQNECVNWEQGDSLVSATGATGVIERNMESSGGGENAIAADGRREIVLADGYEGGYNDWRNVVVTNVTKGDTVVPSDFMGFRVNNKLSSYWPSTDIPYNPQAYSAGYSNNAAVISSSTENTMQGSSYAFLQIATNKNGILGNQGNWSNMAPNMSQRPVLYDTRDNGTRVDFWFEHKRATSLDSYDGIFRLFKKTYREGGDYPELTLIFENTQLPNYASPEPNRYSHRYIFGAQNSGFLEDTFFDVLEHKLYETKPDEISEIGY